MRDDENLNQLNSRDLVQQLTDGVNIPNAIKAANARIAGRRNRRWDHEFLLLAERPSNRLLSCMSSRRRRRKLADVPNDCTSGVAEVQLQSLSGTPNADVDEAIVVFCGVGSSIHKRPTVDGQHVISVSPRTSVKSMTSEYVQYVLRIHYWRQKLSLAIGLLRNVHGMTIVFDVMLPAIWTLCAW